MKLKIFVCSQQVYEEICHSEVHQFTSHASLYAILENHVMNFNLDQFFYVFQDELE